MIRPGIIDARRAAGPAGEAGAYSNLWVLQTYRIAPGSGISGTGDGKEVENLSATEYSRTIPTNGRFDGQTDYVYYEVHIDSASYTGATVLYDGYVQLINGAQYSELDSQSFDLRPHTQGNWFSYGMQGTGFRRSRFSSTADELWEYGKLDGVKTVIRIIYRPSTGQYWWFATDGIDGNSNPYTVGNDAFENPAPDPAAVSGGIITGTLRERHYIGFLGFNPRNPGQRFRLVDDPPDMAFAVPSGCVAMSTIEPVPLVA